jgi:hypothetical protein
MARYILALRPLGHDPLRRSASGEVQTAVQARCHPCPVRHCERVISCSVKHDFVSTEEQCMIDRRTLAIPQSVLARADEVIQ